MAATRRGGEIGWKREAVGDGAPNQSNTAQVNGSAFTAVNQGSENTAVSFTPLW
ncbi:hypothetical protein [Streptomyces sp. TRM68367]|uniref:hypothetical protein n=1 Tax=Streptomyces sp. TRM68367 TaxID=2758415 RepID=UPI00165A41C5|nr:hypothetical protein [Streptomyces sp. TRM68367]MBC9729982.1 hypothetical protein [Streptomyces sp. TRM68367]